MKQDPLPAPFVAWLRSYAASAQFTSFTRLHRGLVLRWCLWRDGIPANALPGYATCPPATTSGFPAGWSAGNLRDICREAIGTQAIHTARRRASRIVHA